MFNPYNQTGQGGNQDVPLGEVVQPTVHQQPPPIVVATHSPHHHQQQPHPVDVASPTQYVQTVDAGGFAQPVQYAQQPQLQQQPQFQHHQQYQQPQHVQPQQQFQQVQYVQPQFVQPPGGVYVNNQQPYIVKDQPQSVQAVPVTGVGAATAIPVQDTKGYTEPIVTQARTFSAAAPRTATSNFQIGLAWGAAGCCPLWCGFIAICIWPCSLGLAAAHQVAIGKSIQENGGEKRRHFVYKCQAHARYPAPHINNKRTYIFTFAGHTYAICLPRTCCADCCTPHHTEVFNEQLGGYNLVLLRTAEVSYNFVENTVRQIVNGAEANLAWV